MCDALPARLANRPIISAALTAIAIVLLTFSIPSTGVADSEYDRESLRGLRGINVTVERIGREFGSIASENEFQTAIELRLRKEGIRVYTEEERLTDPRGPVLYLNVNLLALNDGNTYVCTVVLDVEQILWVVQGGRPVRGCTAITWKASRAVAAYGSLIVRDRLTAWVGSDVDEFVNAWLSTHPR